MLKLSHRYCDLCSLENSTAVKVSAYRIKDFQTREGGQKSPHAIPSFSRQMTRVLGRWLFKFICVPESGSIGSYSLQEVPISGSIGTYSLSSCVCVYLQPGHPLEEQSLQAGPHRLMTESFPRWMPDYSLHAISLFYFFRWSVCCFRGHFALGHWGGVIHETKLQVEFQEAVAGVRHLWNLCY